jgi:ATP-binding cassette subfamily C protein CydC
VALPLWALRRARGAGLAQVRLSAELRTRVIDGVQGLAELINAGADARYAEEIARLSDAWLAAQDDLNRISSLSTAALGLLAGLGIWAVLLLGIPLLQAQLLSGPQLSMLALFALASFEAVAPLPLALQLWSETGAAARRLFEITDQASVTREPAHPRPLPATNELRLEGVALRYPGSRANALTGIDLNLPQGSRSLLLGDSGAGKSSLVNLLLRFWDPSEGRVLLGGCDLRELDSADLRSRISVVSQHTHLFNASIRANLLLAAPQASQAQLERACRAARIHDFISAQPQGYDTWLGETGIKVSGGQARRIAIARALLKDAPILILDEPTEGLDNQTVDELCHTLDEVMHGRTVLVISHRALPLHGITQTITLSEGRLVESIAQAN